MSSRQRSITLQHNRASDHDGISVTELYHPKYQKTKRISSQMLKKSKKNYVHNQEEVLSHYDQLTYSILQIENYIRNRMVIHEDALIKVVRDQMIELLGEVKQEIREYRKKIMENDLDDQIELLKTEVEFFRLQALNVLEEKRQLEVKIKNMSHRLKQLEVQQQCDQQLIQKLKYKEYKHIKKLQKTISLHTLNQNSKNKKFERVSSDKECKMPPYSSTIQTLNSRGESSFEKRIFRTDKEDKDILNSSKQHTIGSQINFQRLDLDKTHKQIGIKKGLINKERVKLLGIRNQISS